MEETKTQERPENPEVDTTKFVNIDTKEFDVYINGKLARHINAGEEQVMPLFVALAGAKHLVDRILQEQHNIHDTLRDTPLRRTLFAQILPDRAEEKGVKPLSEQEFKNEVLKRLEEQERSIASLTNQQKPATSQKDASEDIQKLKNEIAGLKMALGRKAKKEQATPDKVASPETEKTA